MADTPQDTAAKAKADAEAKAAAAKAKAAATVADDEAEESVNPNETVPGGLYVRGATLKGGKLYGGHIGDADGNILAEFKDKEVNTGDPRDGHKPKDDDAA